jgi:L-ascorbate metabolism protein UlaG (beta-lactamase superfamily)
VRKKYILNGRRRALRALALITSAPFLALSRRVQASFQAAHHLSNGTFRNNYIGQITKSFSDLMRWRRESPDHPLLSFSLAANDPAFLRNNRKEATLTWLGHATLLLQVGGVNILTDPHFSDRASPFSFVGPRRGTPPGIPLDELPNIDIVLISHNHYDHLDEDSITRLLRRRADTHFCAPLGIRQWLARVGAQHITELDWGDSVRLNNMQLTAAPCQHWSSRAPWDRNRTLWASWVVEKPGFRFLFIGDTGYSQDFSDLGTHYGGFDVVAIPIGAYEPRWFMKQAHINPDEAVKIFQDLRANTAVATHWGTFQLTDEPMDEPPQKLHAALKAAGIDKNIFAVFQHGETRSLARFTETKKTN